MLSANPKNRQLVESLSEDVRCLRQKIEDKDGESPSTPRREAMSAKQGEQMTPSRSMPTTRNGIPTDFLPTSSRGDF